MRQDAIMQTDFNAVSDALVSPDPYLLDLFPEQVTCCRHIITASRRLQQYLPLAAQ